MPHVVISEGILGAKERLRIYPGPEQNWILVVGIIIAGLVASCIIGVCCLVVRKQRRKRQLELNSKQHGVSHASLYPATTAMTTVSVNNA